MAKLTRKKTILAKIESAYGTDPSPAAANAILVKNLTVTPFNAEKVSRDLYKSYLGASPQLIVEQQVTLEFEVELVASGTRGIAPGWGPLLRACGMAETINTAAVTITRSGSTATATSTAHGLIAGDKVKISGAAQTEYNGTQTVLTAPTADTFTFTVSGTPATPATGTIVIGTTTVYAPVSASFESVSIYFNQDGILHKALGAQGNAEFLVNAKQIPTIKFIMTALYSAPTDTAAPSTDYSLFQTPKAANTTNTPTFSLLSYSGVLESVNINLANEVVHRNLIGSEQIMITNRKVAGAFSIEAPALSGKDFFAAAAAASTGAMQLIHGTGNGFKVKFDSSTVAIENPNYTDSQGIVMLSIPFTAIPSDSGNDEITVTCL